MANEKQGKLVVTAHIPADLKNKLVIALHGEGKTIQWFVKMAAEWYLIELERGGFDEDVME